MTEGKDTQGKWKRRSTSNKEKSDAPTEQRTPSSARKKPPDENNLNKQPDTSEQHTTAVTATIESAEQV